MEYEVFREAVMGALEEVLGDTHHLGIIKMNKINTNYTEGIEVIEKGKEGGPICSLDSLYEQFGFEGDIAGAVNDVVDCSKETIEGIGIDISMLKDWTQVNKLVTRYVINRQYNESLLAQLPHEECLDLAVIYCLEIGVRPKEAMEIKVTYAMLESWDISFAELQEAARDNSDSRSFTIQHIFQSICEMAIEELGSDAPDKEIFGNSDVPLYVVTNKMKLRGAAVLLEPDCLQEYAEKFGCSYYVLPSSIHEILLIPEHEVENTEGIRSMVRDINESSVDEQEVLSNNVYFYDAERQQISLVIS